MKKTRGWMMIGCIAFLFLLAGGGKNLRGAELEEFSFLPPTLGVNGIKPNILFILDRSGSMNIRAYAGMPYAATNPYVGYFEENKCYIYDNLQGRFDSPQPKSGGICVDRWDGNFLNWVAMRRFDLAKWALTGGECYRPRPAPDQCNVFAVKEGTVSPNILGLTSLIGVAPIAFSGTHMLKINHGQIEIAIEGVDSVFLNVRVVAGGRDQTGIIQTVGDRARMGLMITNGETGKIYGSTTLEGDHGAYIDDYTANGAVLVNAVDTVVAKGATPLYHSMYEAARYFAQVEPAWVGDYTNNVKDPYCHENNTTLPGRGCKPGNNNIGQWIG